MIEVTGNLWTYPADVRVITTNGSIRKDGKAVMGRGCAREAAKKYPWIAETLGAKLQEGGNHVYRILHLNHNFTSVGPQTIYSFPVKHHWQDTANLLLIERSAKELLEALQPDSSTVIVLPRPGCGNGHLTWEQVKPVIAPILSSDNWRVITFEGAAN